MAINDGARPTQPSQFSLNNGNNAAQAAAPQSTQASAQQKPSWSFRDLSGLSSSPMGRNVNSEAMAKVAAHLGEIYKNAPAVNDNFDIRLVAVDNNNQRNLAFGALVVCARRKGSNSNPVAWHALILEATGEPIPPRIDTTNGKQIEIPRPTSVAWDQVMFQTVQNAVNTAFPGVTTYPADAAVLPRTLSLEEAHNLFPLARNAIMAVSTELDQREPDRPQLNLRNGSFQGLAVSMSLESQQLPDDANQPMRSDIVIDFSDNAKNNDQQQQSVHNGDRSTTISRLSGFVDFAWAPVNDGSYYQQLQANLANQMGMPSLTQKYAARFVVTNVESLALQTLPATLLALISSTAVGEQMNWAQAFFNRGSNRRLHNIGALNYEANTENNATGVGALVDTTTDSFRPDEHYRLIQTLVRPGIAIAVDVPDCAAQSWYLNVLAAAAQGSTPAQQAIVNALDTLTGGEFSRIMPAGAPLFIDTDNRVHLGYYKAENGVFHDLRDADYLAMLTLKGATELDLVRQWSDTFVQSGYITLNERLDRRLRLIKEILPSATVTGFGTRVTLSPQLLESATRAVAACGVHPTVRVANGVTGLHQTRGTAGFAQSGLLMPGQTQFYSQGPAPQQVVGGYYGFQARY